MSYDRLNEIVNALTAVEKRYVRLFLTRHSGKEHRSLEIFDALTGEKKTPAKKNGAALSLQPHEKTNFYNDVLLALRFFHQERSVDTHIRELLIDADFLFEKRLYDASLNRLAEARKLARQYERRTSLLDVLRLEAAITKEKRATGMQQQLREIHQLQREQIACLGLDVEGWIRLDETEAEIRFQFFDRDAEQNNEAALADLYFDREQGFMNNYLRLSRIALQSVRSKKLDMASRAYELLLEVWSTHPSFYESERMHYKRTLANYINVCQLLGNNTATATLIARLREVPSRTAEEEAEQFQVVMFAELMLLMNTGMWKKLSKLVKEIEKGLAHYQTKINRARDLAFRCNIAICWIMLEDWKQALHWINSIIETEKTDHRKDLQQLARLFRLLLYFELDKHDLLEYELINVERYLRQRKAWFAYEATIVKFFKKLLSSDLQEHPPLFEKFRTQLNEASEGKNSASLPGATELQLWARHHSSGKPIRELLREGTEV